MELDCFEWAQMDLARNGVTEPLTMDLIQQILGVGDTYIDVGAHVGFVSLVARQSIGQEGRVFAIDPQPYNCEKLLRNWELNDFSNLIVHVAAAGAESGFVELPQQANTDKSRLSLELGMPNALDLKFVVPMVAIADLMDRHNIASVDLLKIDVEGFELKVLQGLKDRIADVKNVVFEALHEDEEDRQRTRAVCDWLRAQGFEIRTVQGEVFRDAYPVPEENLWGVRG